MRIAIMSDIHGNAEALRAVLRDIAREQAPELVCLGDLVGYNAQAAEVISLTRRFGISSVYGHHDLMVAGRLPITGSPRARRAAEWTSETLSTEDITFLRHLPGAIRRPEGLLFVHSALGDPVVRLRTDDQLVAHAAELRRLVPGTRVCFTGHMHEPRILEIPADGNPISHSPTSAVLRRNSFYFVNPGSVGEPKGTDPRAIYAVYDGHTGHLSFRRVTYDRERLDRENHRRGLPAHVSRSPVARLRAGVVAAARRLIEAPSGF